VLVSQDHIERDGENGAHEEHLQHEVVQSLLEDCAERFCHERGAHVVTKVNCAVGEIRWRQTLLHVDLKERANGFTAYKTVMITGATYLGTGLLAWLGLRRRCAICSFERDR